ncbi:2-hydroxy-6-ketonona-2,4-dienedioic acid hydrolase [Escherichia coli]|nr:2-hydroxy-6-ketonona-2,4-dienedioic acid hydrolase [Escherichia coli]
MSYQPQTEAATSRFLNVEEAGKTLRIHFNDCGQGDETVVLLAWFRPGCYWLGETSAAISIRW